MVYCNWCLFNAFVVTANANAAVDAAAVDAAADVAAAAVVIVVLPAYEMMELHLL